MSSDAAMNSFLSASERSQFLTSLTTEIREARKPPKKRNPATWADENRVFPKGSAEPGPHRSSRTPYVIPIANGLVDPRYARGSVVMGTQMGKTTGLLNVIGQRLDDDPVPCLYVGPTKSNIDKVIEPQVVAMLRDAASLAAKAKLSGKTKTHVKDVGGVTLRLAWAGSPTEVAAASAAIVLVDEVDKMKAIPGEGDPVTLAEARPGAYADGKMIASSSPTDGNVETEVDPVSGIEHWTLGAADDIGSPIWKLFQEGTRYEWSVPCPHCAEFFVPRFKLLVWPEGCTPKRALRDTSLTCQRCGVLIGNEHKSAMNACGTFLAPGQKVEGFTFDGKRPPAHAWLGIESDNGAVVGDPPDSDAVSFWVSGIMSPFRTFGERVSQWLRAAASGDQERIRSVINTGFGELYRTRGSAPEWEAVRDMCATPYALGDVPRGVQRLFLTVDVQKNRLVCSVRGWGAEFESWLVHREELWGETDQIEVWNKLDALKVKQFGGEPIRATAVDAGYRQEHAIEWCRRNGASCYATKGRENPSRLYSQHDVEVNRAGKKFRTGMKLWTVDHAYMKAWVQDRFAWPQDQAGAWHIPGRAADGEFPPGTEEYCKQLVGEARMRLPSGRAQWVRTGENHFLDCEALQVFLAHIEGVRHLRPITEEVQAVAVQVPQRRIRSSGVSVF